MQSINARLWQNQFSSPEVGQLLWTSNLPGCWQWESTCTRLFAHGFMGLAATKLPHTSKGTAYLGTLCPREGLQADFNKLMLFLVCCIRVAQTQLRAR